MNTTSPLDALSPKQSNECTVLITGGAGFIGSGLIRHWLATYPNDTVINLDLTLNWLKTTPTTVLSTAILGTRPWCKV
jgi:hypothetical protein